MILLVCLLCSSEPFACPEKFRPSHMAYHLRTVHKLDGVRLSIQQRGNAQVYSMGRGRHAEPLLKAVDIRP